MGGQYPGYIPVQKCAACAMCSQQFTPGEPRLQQRANCDAQRAYVHAQCITGGIGRDRELVLKVPADIEARDNVICMRDSVLSAAAAAEVVLPIHDPHEDNSTDAPDDDRLFDREEALRHNDAIMEFQWFNTIPWTEIKDPGGTTFVQPPARLRYCLATGAARHLTGHYAPRTLIPQR